ncbi:MAG: guanylate kinase [Planctomycetales bacterium]
MDEASRDGKVVIIAGPSGSGKSTVLPKLLASCSVPLMFSISATTREPRPAEVDGKNYHFLTEEDFARRRENSEFLECFEVFGKGHWYGTLWSEVTSILEQGKWVLLEIDVQGTLRALEKFPDAVTIFLEPPSLEELERRLTSRNTESREHIERRLETARREIQQAGRFRHRVVNHNSDDAVREIRDILEQPEDDS